MENLDFGKKLIEVRKQKGLTQADVAEKCNVTIRTIQRIESGSVKPRSSTIKIISKALEFDFFETSTQNSKLKSHTMLWYVKDLFNFKTNAMKKISILTVFFLITAFTFSNLFSSKAQSTNSENEQKTVDKSPEVLQKNKSESQDKKIDFSDGYDQIEVHGDMVVIMKNNKYGLTNRDGKVIIPCEYDRFEIKGNLITTAKNNKFGLMNLDGKVIVPCKYDNYEIKGRYITTTKNFKFGLMNLDGETIIPCEYDNYEIKGRYIATTKNFKYGLMNLDGETIIPCEYDAMKIEGSTAFVTKNGKTEQIQI